MIKKVLTAALYFLLDFGKVILEIGKNLLVVICFLGVLIWIFGSSLFVIFVPFIRHFSSFLVVGYYFLIATIFF